jgi:hypothetical protein
MKKSVLCLLLICSMLLILPALAFERDQVVPRLEQQVKALLDRDERKYTYEDEMFTVDIRLDTALAKAKMWIFLYDDMLSTQVELPIRVPEENRDKMAKLLTLINYKLYYSQLRMDYSDGQVANRSYILIETALPGDGEIEVLLNQPVYDLEAYADAISKVALAGADPQEAFDAARAAIEAGN